MILIPEYLLRSWQGLLVRRVLCRISLLAVRFEFYKLVDSRKGRSIERGCQFRTHAKRVDRCTAVQQRPNAILVQVAGRHDLRFTKAGIIQNAANLLGQ